jgi:ribose transport system substrate-binding protein
MNRRDSLRVSLSALATGLLLLALSPAAGLAAASHRVAFLASSSENGFNQAIWEGVKKRGAELGIEVEIFNGEFNAEKQNNQVEDLVASKKRSRPTSRLSSHCFPSGPSSTPWSRKFPG